MTSKEKLILTLTILILVFVYVFGLSKMYFHQDDVDFLVAVSADWPKTIWLPVNEHAVILFWLLYRLEWWFFGINFGGFLTVSLLLHGLNLFLAGRLVYEETRSRYYGLLTGLILAVNNNWNESVWWSTGQMWLLATLFGLISLLLLRSWQRGKIGGIYWGLLIMAVSALPGLSWGVGLLWPLILLVSFRFLGSLKYGLLISQGALLLVYQLLASPKNLASLLTLGRLVQMVIFVIVGLANTVVGRLVFPWENKPIRFLVLAGLLVLLLKTFRLWRGKVVGWPLSLTMASILIYATYSLGRASFGVGQAMATRYAYLPTFFLVMAVMVVWAKVKFGRQKESLALGAAIYLAVAGLLVFNWRVTEWTKRPQMVRWYFNSIKRLSADNCLIDEPLPKFINPDPTRRLSDLRTPLRLDWQSGTTAQGCVSVFP